MEIPGVELLELIARGANGSVYRGTESELDRQVAVKVAHASLDGQGRRSERERRAMGRLSSIPAVAPIYRFGELDSGESYLVMPLYQRSLQNRIEEEGPIGVGEALPIIRTISGAVAAAHDRDILHLDTKPSNILLDAADNPYLADFGIAELTDTSASLSGSMMTPHYSPPERFHDVAPTEAADIYGLGATLFATLVGAPPFATSQGSGPAAVMMKVVNEPPPLSRLPSDVPADVRHPLATSMAKDPEERPGVSAFGHRLQATFPSPLPTTQSVDSNETVVKPVAMNQVIAGSTAQPSPSKSATPPAFGPPPQPEMTEVRSQSLGDVVRDLEDSPANGAWPYAKLVLIFLVLVLVLSGVAIAWILSRDDGASPTPTTPEAAETTLPSPAESDPSTTIAPETTAAPETTTEAPTTTAAAPYTMWQALNDSGEAGQFAAVGAALGLQADLEALVDEDGVEVNRTLFALSDESMALLDVPALAADPEGATALIGYHFIDQRLSAADLAERDGQAIITRTGLPMTITVDGDDILLNGNSLVISSDIEADNGIIHIITPALTPPTVNEVLSIANIEFEVGSAVITAAGQAELQKSITFFAQNPSVNAEIQAHTDTDGSAEGNLALSQARAEAVVDFLVAGGISDDRLTATGFGETQPILVDGVEDKAASRRIEFNVR